jgi:hypothetical protein
VIRNLLILIIACLAAPATAQMWPSPGPGHAAYSAPGGGGACSTPTDFSATAVHLYFWQDSSWTTAGDPDDEAGATPLEDSANLTEADLTTADLPAGTPTASTYVAVDMDGSTEEAHTITATEGFIVASDFGDYTSCAWVKLSEFDAGVDHITFYSHGQSDDGWIGYNSDGSVQANSPGASALTSTAGDVSTGSWHHVCLTSDGDGGGTNVRRIYVNGSEVAADGGATLNLYYDGTASTPQGINAVHASLNHGWGIWHSALSAADIKTMACCGLGGEVDDLSARETLTGLDCSGE